WAFDQYISFYAKFSKPFTYQLVTDSASLDPGSPRLPMAKALLRFKTQNNEQVYVKVGISAVDMQGAQQNVEAEIPDWDFERIKKDAYHAWNTHLSKIKIKTGDETQKNIFYTALYHTAISPNLFADTDGRYRGMDQQIHQCSVTDPLYTVFSLWDTYRGFHPLLSIVDPELNNAFVRSLILKHKEGGLLPMWDLASNYTATMIGYHAVPVLVDAYMKGERDFDVAAAYEACLKVANYDTTNIVCPPAVLPHLVPKSKYYKNELGYIPCDLEHESVAKAMEYAYNDWCVSAFAEKLGDQENALKFASLSKSYERYFDTETRFMRGVDSNGAWRTPFHPRSSSHRNDDYCEGTAWQWTWSVQHDVPGLIRLMGGKDGFVAKLDSLFTEESALEGENTSVDISGLIGQYAHGNEPSHHIIHLYNYVGQPYKTQQLVDSVLYGQYSDQVDGLSGNEDCGQMSAWYILNAMGFYQVCPGNPVYSLGRPLFDEVVIPLRGGREFVIRVINNSRKN
ncbi:MAG: GH92 family glycosyl hydrolase, partial [Bacteroidales bacterium]